MRIATNKSVHAGALLYALLVSVLIAGVTTAILYLFYYYKIVHNQEILQEHLTRNAYSGLELLIHSSGKFSEKEAFDLYSEKTDSVEVGRRTWGFFDVLSSKALRHTTTGEQFFSKIALVGAIPDSIDKAAFYLQDNNDFLFLSGTTQVVGDAYLPKLGAKPGIIDRQSYIGDQLIYGNILESDRYLPGVDLSRIEKILQLSNTATNGNSEISQDSINNSFSDSPVVIRRKTINLNQVQLVGNVIIIGDSLIRIKENALLEDVILIAPTIIFEKGVHCTVQAIATKQLLIGQECHFSYPSVLGLLSFRNLGSENSLWIDKNSFVEGLVIAIGTSEYPYRPKVTTEVGSQVQGQLYAIADTELKGEIYGNVTVSNLYVNAEGRSFNNYLHNVVIDISKRSPFYVSPIFLNKKSENQIIKWLQ